MYTAIHVICTVRGMGGGEKMVKTGNRRTRNTHFNTRLAETTWPIQIEANGWPDGSSLISNSIVIPRMHPRISQANMS